MIRIAVGIGLALVVLFSVVQVQRSVRKPHGCGRGCPGCGTSAGCPAIDLSKEKGKDRESAGPGSNTVKK